MRLAAADVRADDLVDPPDGNLDRERRDPPGALAGRPDEVAERLQCPRTTRQGSEIFARSSIRSVPLLALH